MSTTDDKNTTTNDYPRCNHCGELIKPPKTQCAATDGTFICSDCVNNLYAVIHAEDTYIEGETEDKSKADALMTPPQIKEFLDQYIEGQEEAKEVLSVAVYNHYKMINIKDRYKKKGINSEVELEKSNILLVGPSGSGKTALLKALSKALKVPFTIADITAFSSAGYVGRDVESILRDLVTAANGDIEAASHGIIYIDEIDKISRKGENLSTTADPGHEGVQQSLLKLLEGSIVDVPPEGVQRIRPDQKNMIRMSTENILFVVGGAFEGIEKIIAKRLRSQNGSGATIGFEARLADKKGTMFNQYITDVTTEDLRKFGMLPELLGRVPVIAPLKELTEDQLMNILTEPKNALIKQYRELLKEDNIMLEITSNALRQIAKDAIKRKTGARGLRGIVEKVLMRVMYEAPAKMPDSIKIDLVEDKIESNFEYRKDVANE